MNYKAIDKKIKEALKKVGFYKGTRTTWFKKYSFRFDAQLTYQICTSKYDCDKDDIINVSPYVILKFAFVVIWYTLEEAKVLYKLTKKALKDKEKIAKILKGVIEVE